MAAAYVFLILALHVTGLASGSTSHPGLHTVAAAAAASTAHSSSAASQEPQQQQHLHHQTHQPRHTDGAEGNGASDPLHPNRQQQRQQQRPLVMDATAGNTGNRGGLGGGGAGGPGNAAKKKAAHRKLRLRKSGAGGGGGTLPAEQQRMLEVGGSVGATAQGKASARQVVTSQQLAAATAANMSALLRARASFQPPQPWNTTLTALTTKYLSNAETVVYVERFLQRCGHVARKFSFGKSQLLHHDMMALEISINAGVREPKPYFRYTANIHGNEPSGRILLLLLAEWLCANYRSDGMAKLVVRDMHLILVLSANPDGFDRQIRENANGVDLNRNFPDPWKNWNRNISQPVGGEQAETLALMKVAQEYKSVGSLNIHEGALVANYPYDGYMDSSLAVRGVINPSPDDATFQFLAKQYANLHPTMHKSAEFPGGITNGARWYPVYGGMQDWVYLVTGCLELTLELNNEKWPSMGRLADMWSENRVPLLQAAITTGLAGLRGRVFSTSGKHIPLEATITVLNGGRNTSSSAMFGDYYRPLPPGTYNITASLRGYLSASATITIPKTGTGFVKDFYLHPAAAPATVDVSKTGAAGGVGGQGSGAGKPGTGAEAGGGHGGLGVKEEKPPTGGADGGTGSGTGDHSQGGGPGKGTPHPASASAHHAHQGEGTGTAEDKKGAGGGGEEVVVRDPVAAELAKQAYLRERARPPSDTPVIWTVLVVIGVPLVGLTLCMVWRSRTRSLSAAQIVYLPVNSGLGGSGGTRSSGGGGGGGGGGVPQGLELKSAPTGGRPDYSLHQLLAGPRRSDGMGPGSALAGGSSRV